MKDKLMLATGAALAAWIMGWIVPVLLIIACIIFYKMEEEK